VCITWFSINSLVGRRVSILLCLYCIISNVYCFNVVWLWCILVRGDGLHDAAVNEKVVQNMCSGNRRERPQEKCRILQKAVLACLKTSWH